MLVRDFENIHALPADCLFSMLCIVVIIHLLSFGCLTLYDLL